MEKEYGNGRLRRHETFAGRVTLNSAASLIRGEDMSRDEKRNCDAHAAPGQYIERLCERYRDRGIASHVHADAAMQEKKEALTRAMAPGAYVMTERLHSQNTGNSQEQNRYRSGVSDGKRYMTVEDFDRFYHDQRGYKKPQYRFGTSYDAYEMQAVASSDIRPQTTQPKKAGWLTDTDKLPAQLQKLFKFSFVRRLNEWAGETFPRETNMRRAAKTRRAVPAGLIASLVTVAVSMTMIVGSTVLVSRSQRQVSMMKTELEAKQEMSDELSDKLDLKNDMMSIRDVAVNKLGMVDEEYLSGTYIGQEKEDTIEVYDKEDKTDNGGLSAILSAFGFGD